MQCDNASESIPQNPKATAQEHITYNITYNQQMLLLNEHAYKNTYNAIG